MKELVELLEDCANSDMVTTEVQEKSQKVLNHINKKNNNQELSESDKGE